MKKLNTKEIIFIFYIILFFIIAFYGSYEIMFLNISIRWYMLISYGITSIVTIIYYLTNEIKNLRK